MRARRWLRSLDSQGFFLSSKGDNVQASSEAVKRPNRETIALKTQWLENKRCSLSDSNARFLSVAVQVALDKGAPLETQSSNEQVDAHTAEAIFLQEGHDKAKPSKYHNVYILEYCKRAEGEKKNPV